MIWMDVDTALSEVPVNTVPLMSDTDFKTVDEGILYNESGMALYWHYITTDGATTVTNVTPTVSGDYDWAHQDHGMYTVEVTPSGGASINNDTEGFGYFTGVCNAVLPWRGPTIGFRAAALNNAMIDGGDNLDVNTVQWLGTACAEPTTAGVPEVDVTFLSGDATAAENLESQYDTTGLSGGTFPATQTQIGNLTSGTAAINTVAESFTKSGAESETNDYTDTAQKNGVYHIVEDDGDATDAYYQFDIGGNGVPVSITWTGYAQAINETYNIYAYNYDTGPAYEQVGSITGTTLTTQQIETFDLTNAHVGTGANLGKVRFRFLSADGAAFATDRILCSYAVVAQSVGYAEGAIWVDSAGTAGSELYINGTADNPCPWANALVIAAALGIERFHIANDVTITLDAAFDDKTMYGDHFYLALDSQSINDSYFKGATITGISSAANHALFEDCEIGAATIPPCRMVRCGIGESSGTFTAASDGNYTFIDCYSLVPGSGSPNFAFAGLGSTTGINNRRWSGGATWVLDSDCTLSQEVVTGGGQTFTTGGADVEIRGICRSVTLTLSGAGTVQFAGVTGPITISGTATTTVNIYGVSYLVTDTSVNTTVNDHTVSTLNNADELLNRDLGDVTLTNTRSPMNALRMLRNKWAIDTGILTIYEEDDSTPAWTSAVTTDATANPVKASDPA